MDPDHSGQCDRDEFLKACEELDVQDGDQIFEWMDADESGFVTLEEIDQEAYEAYQRGEEEKFERDFNEKMMSDEAKARRAFYERMEGSKTAIRQKAIGVKHRKDVKAKLEKDKHDDLAAYNLSELKVLAKRKFGNLWHWWALSVDPENLGFGRVKRGALFRAARSSGFKGTLETLWTEMNPVTDDAGE